MGEETDPHITRTSFERQIETNFSLAPICAQQQGPSTKTSHCSQSCFEDFCLMTSPTGSTVTKAPTEFPLQEVVGGRPLCGLPNLKEPCTYRAKSKAYHGATGVLLTSLPCWLRGQLQLCILAIIQLPALLLPGATVGPAQGARRTIYCFLLWCKAGDTCFALVCTHSSRSTRVVQTHRTGSEVISR